MHVDLFFSKFLKTPDFDPNLCGWENFTPLNNSETVKDVTLAFCGM